MNPDTERTLFRALFDMSDESRDGYLDKHEAAKLLSTYGRVPPSAEEIDNALSKFDTNRDGKLGFDEFVSFAKAHNIKLQ
ncbi:hypothetical protein BGW42_002005 [Actinomortierella wolfii]|nr:hypothetical protein BGW41_004601 [Actinomortierella wolfii]KAG0228763.1 hypothetical protein BGW42_002005 [Actinomortierella wolfii]